MQKIILVTNSAKHFGLENTNVEIGRFPDGEISVVLKKDLKGKNVFVIGSTQAPAENLMELILLIHKVASSAPKKLTVIIPFLGYSRADREAKKGEVISSSAVAKMLEAVGGKNFRVIFFNLHSPRILRFFQVPTTEVDAVGIMAKYFLKKKDLMVVAPDDGAYEMAKKFTEFIGARCMVEITKERLTATRVKIKRICGEIGEKVVIVDDMVETGNTVLKVAKKLKSEGVKEICVAVTHMIYPAGGWKKLAASPLISKVYTTDTIAPPSRLPEKFKVVSIKPILKKLIYP